MGFAVIIPARMASQRLPGKPLADLLGKPLIVHVCERAQESGAAHILVATDDSRIYDACAAAGFQAEMTSATHSSGTDRIAEVANRLGWSDEEIVVNLQGDEPLMPAVAIRQVAALLDSHAGAHMATLCTPIHALDEFMNPNVVKVVTGQNGNALYFSRAPVPWNREGADHGINVTAAMAWRPSAYRPICLSRSGIAGSWHPRLFANLSNWRSSSNCGLCGLV